MDGFRSVEVLAAPLAGSPKFHANVSCDGSPSGSVDELPWKFVGEPCLGRSTVGPITAVGAVLILTSWVVSPVSPNWSWTRRRTVTVVPASDAGYWCVTDGPDASNVPSLVKSHW